MLTVEQIVLGEPGDLRARMEAITAESHALLHPDELEAYYGDVGETVRKLKLNRDESVLLCLLRPEVFGGDSLV